jgi:serine/threonine-protein kinase
VPSADDREREREEEPIRLGRYTLLRRIGKGGMGEVYLGKVTGAHGFEKPVAIKRILPEYAAHPQIINMLVDEARISVLLSHPNVVQVLELCDDPGGCFIVMEYVEGHALSRLLRALRKAGKRLDVLDACFVAIHVLDGLHAAHVQKDTSGQPAGIIHRDVSPQNVLLSMDGHVKVIDFGIARARERLEVTQGTSIKGKLRYMAPEQLSPRLLKGATLDHRADVFAAGVVLFEMLADRQRFPGKVEADIVDAILGDETPDLVAEGLVEPELMAILDGALEKDRRRRTKDAATFAGQLRGYLYKRDPAYTPERLARRMREMFGGPEEAARIASEPDESARTPQRTVNQRGADRSGSRSGNDRTRTLAPDDERTTGHGARRGFERSDAGPSGGRGSGGGFAVSDPPRYVVGSDPRASASGSISGLRVSSPPTLTGRRRPSRRRLKILPIAAGSLIGAALLWLLSRPFFAAPPPASAPPLVAPTRSAEAAPAPPIVPPTTHAEAPAAPPPPVVSAPPPVPTPPRAAKLGAPIEIEVRAQPPTARVSLAADPGRTFASPAKLKVKQGEALDIVVEAPAHASLELKRVADAAAPVIDVKLAPLPVELAVRVFPADASVTVDGKAWSPGFRVVPGEPVEVRATHPQAHDKTVIVTAKPGETLDVPITLEPTGAKVAARPGGTLVVSSDPSGAEVFVGGRRRPGVTPLEVFLPVGQHRITVRGAAGEQMFLVDISQGARVKRKVTLE